jgi:outer membrane protein OmpA-like peptidoglycan-associated protein
VRPTYIFSSACVEVFIFISLFESCLLPRECLGWPSATRIPLTVPLLNPLPEQHQLTWQRGALISAAAGLPQATHDGSTITPQASTAPTNEPNHKHAPPRLLEQALLFDPSSTALTSESQKKLTLDAGWLQKHPEVRIFVVGFCDPLGSEECTHELAEGRAAGVRGHLEKYGVRSSQIVAARGWEKADPVCKAATSACQAMNRRARIFIAESALAH